MSHTALARKYRPRTFGDVATQEHVSETLRRAVSTARVGHAYLFCGPRGVGKTTLARVLAMALNCPGRTDEGEPCGVCESCSRIWGGQTALDVVEIDAASNRGVDDARELRERAMYAPSEPGRYKVYIVDEAHMLTREAWNALLKILEEPPARVIFVFATTEPQKIQQSAAPILSRCQRFDFRRIGVADIVSRLASVLEGEGAGAPVEALRMIARKADGGMRDGLSLLDQVIALTGGEITQESVRRVLGLVEEERYLELIDILSEGRHADVFRFVEALLDEGYDLVEFYHGLVETLRGLLRLALGDEDLDLPEELRESMRTKAVTFSPADLVRMLALASDLEMGGSLRRTTQPQVLIEMLLLRLSYLDRTVALEEVLDGIRGGQASGSSGTPPRGNEGSNDEGDRRSDPPARAPMPEPTTEPSFATPITDDPGRAWQMMLDDPGGLPSGLTPLLRAATVRVVDRALVVELPDGPAMERMSRTSVQRAVRDALARFLGVPPDLSVTSPSSDDHPAPGRITRETVLADRVRVLVQQEPLLERAVQELDLELMD